MSLPGTCPIPVPAAAPSGGVNEQVVSGATGTNIGDMTNRGGLAAAFDGNTSQVFSSACSKDGAGTSTYAGKNYSGGKAITKVECWGSSNFGYVATGNPSVTLELYGKNGAPSNATDGTLLGTTGSFTDASNTNAKTITSGNQTTKYSHVWVRISADGTVSDGTSFSEIIFYENLNA